MQARSIRRAVLAAVAGAAGLALVTASGGTAGAAVVSQSLRCSPGGTQAVTLSASGRLIQSPSRAATSCSAVGVRIFVIAAPPPSPGA